LPAQEGEVISAEYSLQMLQEAAALLQTIASIADSIPVTRVAEQSMTLIEEAVVAIRLAIPRRTNDEA
jgi:hypothetical protein